MSGEAFEKRRRAFEEEFIQKQERKLIDKLRDTLHKQQSREELEQVSGIHDPAVLDTLMAMHVAKDTFAAFALYPLVEVAWADGEVDDKERKAFLVAAAELGIAAGSPAHAALEEFVKTKPSADTRKAWFTWATEINRHLDSAERRKVRDGLIKRARAVAEASGGILGLGNKVSKGEQRALDSIASAFPD